MTKTEEFKEVNVNLKALGKTLSQIMNENQNDAAKKLIEKYQSEKS